MDSSERSKLRLSPSADCSSSPPFWSPPLPTPSAVASAVLADPSVAAAVDPADRRRRRARRPCRLRRCPPGHQAAVASATLVYALSLSDAAAQGRPPASSTTGPPAASPTSPSIAAQWRSHQYGKPWRPPYLAGDEPEPPFPSPGAQSLSCSAKHHGQPWKFVRPSSLRRKNITIRFGLQAVGPASAHH
ncbi:hypothetical protein PVAP13_6NG266032 [Panicum virgatum]|uniref:Uncharacterized protein n=1 Tax=Panicum virgatum TaxID=38727 RepID=A0A8T0R247_PANVG|nr:hypothetical protein PVAP13_6NG266032 [Panicum virgatum]